MSSRTSSPLDRAALRGLRVIALVALLTQVLVLPLSFSPAARAEEAPAAESTAEPAAPDSTAPVVAVPGDLTADADPSSGAAVVEFVVSATDDVDGAVDVMCDWPTGSSFPVGATVVTCVATDAAGNQGAGSFSVTVISPQDAAPPVVTNVPADVAVDAEDDTGATVQYDLPTATDDVDGEVPVACAPSSGSRFAIGSTTVTCSASDSSGNGAEASFVVTVRPLPTGVPADTPAALPTDTPTPTPTTAATEVPAPTPTATPAAPPTIGSDKDDYAPGEEVTLAGANWRPGETVHIFVNDDEGQTWKRDVDVVADEGGVIADAFNLPDWFVATYRVKATGTQSGTATATFTDSITAGVTSVNSNAGSSGSVTVLRPANVVSGDVLIAQITYSGTVASGGLATLGQPTGWSLINRRDNSPVIGQAIYWKVAGTSEPLSYTWTFSPSRRATGAITVYKGAQSPNPIDASASAIGSGTSLTAPSVTTSTRSTMVVTFYGIAANTTLAPPPGMDQQYAVSSATAGLALLGSSVVQFDTVATGTNTATSGQSALWVAHTIALRWIQTDTGGSGGVAVGSLVQDKPANATEGDVLIANIMTRGSAASITAPAGWTLIAKRTNTASQLVTQATYWKVVGSAEPATYTWTFSPNVVAVGGIVAYAGIDPQNPIEAFATNPAADASAGGSFTLTAPGVTTTSADAVVVALYAASTNGAINPPTGMLERYDVSSVSSKIAVFDVQQAVPGFSGAKAASDSASSQYVAQTIALRLESSGPTKLAFTTAATAGAVNDCLGPITVQTQNGENVPTNVAATTAVNLATTGMGTFFSDAACASLPVASVSIAAGGNAASFTYRPTARGSGSHELTASAAGLASATQAQTVDKASQSIVFAALADATYGDAPFAVSASGGGSGNTVSFSAGPAEACTAGGANGATITITGAGSCTITASQAGTDDYQPATSVSRTFAIAPKQLTGGFTAESKTYDGTTVATIATRSVAGVVGTDDVSLVGGTAVFADVNAGTAITVTVTGFTLAGTAAARYSLAPGPWTATADITARPIAVTAQEATKVYGTADPEFTYAITGGSLVHGDLLAGALARAAGENVGSYAIQQGTLSAGSNYEITYAGANLTITERPVTVTADNAAKVIGAADPALTYAVTAGTVVDGDAFSGGVARDPGESAGSYAIRQGTLSLGLNYAVTFIDGTFKIVYGFGGFLQPINYTAHTTGVQPNTSIFKAGSTVPVKFELRDAADNLLPCAGPAIWVGYVKGGPTSSAVNEATFSDPATGGGTYLCSNGQYHFNWSTKGLQAGYCYRVGVKLADGETYYVYIGLR